jgi:hypothetical protein
MGIKFWISWRNIRRSTNGQSAPAVPVGKIAGGIKALDVVTLG